MSNVQFHPYQVEGIVRAYHALKNPEARGGFYVQWKPGMGKTLGAIALHRKLGQEAAARGERMRTLVVCPVVAQGVWDREFDKWLPGTHVVRDSPTDDCDVVVTTYDKVKDPKSDNPLKQRRTGTDRLLALQRWSPTLVIFDEAQYFKSPSTARTRAAWKLAAASTYKLLLSGTPAHSPLDWWSQFRVVAPHEDVFKQPYQTFKANALVLQQGPNGAYPMRGRNGALIVKADFQKVVEAMAPYVHAVSKDALGLPEPITTEVPLDLGAKERKAYREMEQFLRTELTEVTEANATIVLTQMLRLSQIAAGHVTDENGDTVVIGDSKVSATLELIDERDEEKVVVACRFKQDIASLKEGLEKANRPFRVIDGSTSAGARTRAEDWFQNEEHNGVMLLQYQAGGVAITLSRASTIIMHTLTLSVIQWEQMISRVHRIGTTTNVQVLYPLAKDTHDEIMLAALRRGASQVDMARLLLKYLNRIDGGAR